MGNRPYQDKIIRVVEDMMYHGQRQLTITLPTGAGKTRIAVQLIYKTGNRRTITVLPSSEIFEQTCEKLDEYNVPYVRLEAGGRPDLSECNNLVAMSQTLARRKATDMFDHWSPEVIVIDAWNIFNLCASKTKRIIFQILLGSESSYFIFSMSTISLFLKQVLG